MSGFDHTQWADAPPRGFDLDVLGTCLVAIRSLTASPMGLQQEDTYAVFQLAILAIGEWRLIVEADARRELRR